MIYIKYLGIPVESKSNTIFFKIKIMEKEISVGENMMETDLTNYCAGV